MLPLSKARKTMQPGDMQPALRVQVLDNAAFEPIGRTLLEPCPRNAADQATVIRRRLKQDLGRWQAEAVLSCYTEVCLRHHGKCSRYFVDNNNATLRLRRLASTDAEPQK